MLTQNCPIMRFILFLLLVIWQFSFGQKEGCNPSAEIFITNEEIQLSSQKYEIIRDADKNYVIFYPPGEKHSFWYKIMVDSDCRFSFKITSSDSIKSSQYFLYKNPEMGNFCNELRKKRIIPARSGEFFEERQGSARFFSSGGQKNDVSFIQPVTATKGEIYFLNIKHKEESECGHYLNLIVSSEVVSFRATYPKCFEEEKSGRAGPPVSLKVTPPPVQLQKAENIADKPKIEVKKEVTSGENFKSDSLAITLPEKTPERISVSSAADNTPVKRKEITEIEIPSGEKTAMRRNISHVTVSGFVSDSISKSTLQAELKWVDDITGKEILATANPNGQYSMVLDEKVIYKLTCSMVGYREKTIKFIRQNLNSDTYNQDFSLVPLKAGENFILKNIYFYAGTYAMKPESQPELDKLYSFLASREKVKIEIQGHTNGEGKVKKQKLTTKKKAEEGWDFHGNEKKLSKYRAEAIKTYLLKKGISEEKISTSGMGATKMLYPEPKNQKEREANRRVEVYLMSSSTDLVSVLNAISQEEPVEK